jgi:hypothetical protein
LINGIYDKKTGANARSSTPGDIWLEDRGVAIFACEVKDSSKQFGFEILSAVRERIRKNPGLRAYWLVTASDFSWQSDVANDSRWGSQIREFDLSGCPLLAMTVYELLTFVEFFETIDSSMLDLISTHIQSMEDLKKETVNQWIGLLQTE